MQVYLDLLKHLLDNGVKREDRTGTGTIGVFGYCMRIPLAPSFPLITTKKIHFKSVAHELLWFLKGDTNIQYLKENKVRIWDEWADEKGELGPVYGKQWRRWEGRDGKSIDQIRQVIESIKKNPYSRRHIVNAWNVSDIDTMKLPPCHVLFQFYVEQEGRLSISLYQRSGDVFLGIPFNIASYALLAYMVASVCNLKLGSLVHFIGDTHLYLNHIEQAHEQLSRSPRPLPRLELDPKKESIFDYKYEDIKLYDYNPHPTIKAEVSV